MSNALDFENNGFTDETRATLAWQLKRWDFWVQVATGRMDELLPVLRERLTLRHTDIGVFRFHAKERDGSPVRFNLGIRLGNKADPDTLTADDFRTWFAKCPVAEPVRNDDALNEVLRFIE